MNQAPKWTVLYNIPGEYVGTGWEFFSSEEEADKRYTILKEHKYVPCKRKFYPSDIQHLGAAHIGTSWYEQQNYKANFLESLKEKNYESKGNS